MLDVKRLRVLREVAAKGSFSAAAESLAYTQSAVSQQIAALEREAGTHARRPLRARRPAHRGRARARPPRRRDPRPARRRRGRARGDRRPARRPPAARRVRHAPARRSCRGRSRASASGTRASSSRSSPAEPDEALARLRAGEADIALTIDAPNARDDDDGVDRTHLLDDPMYVAPAERAPARAQARTSSSPSLADEAWIGGSTGGCPDTLILLRACKRAGFEPRIAFHSDDYLAIQGFVAAGVGVCAHPRPRAARRARRRRHPLARRQARRSAASRRRRCGRLPLAGDRARCSTSSSRSARSSRASARR